MTYEQLASGVNWTLGYWRRKERKVTSRCKCRRYSDFSYSALRARGDDYWLHLERMSESDLGEELVTCFLNQWDSRVCKPETEKGKTMLHHLKEVVDGLPSYYAALGGHGLRDVDFSRQVRVDGKQMPVVEVVARIYAEFRGIQPRFGATAASKLMHMANPGLFVMWDRDIRNGYGVPRDVFGRSYIAFLVLMQESVRHVQETQRGDSQSNRLQGLGLSITRLLDIANYPIGHHVVGSPDTKCRTCLLRANDMLDGLETATSTAPIMAQLRVGRFT